MSDLTIIFKNMILTGIKIVLILFTIGSIEDLIFGFENEFMLNIFMIIGVFITVYIVHKSDKQIYPIINKRINKFFERF